MKGTRYWTTNYDCIVRIRLTRKKRAVVTHNSTARQAPRLIRGLDRKDSQSGILLKRAESYGKEYCWEVGQDTSLFHSFPFPLHSRKVMWASQLGSDFFLFRIARGLDSLRRREHHQENILHGIFSESLSVSPFCFLCYLFLIMKIKISIKCYVHGLALWYSLLWHFLLSNGTIMKRLLL